MSRNKNWIALLDRDVWMEVLDGRGKPVVKFMLTDYSVVNGSALLTLRLDSGISMQVSMSNVKLVNDIFVRIYNPIEFHPTKRSEFSPKVVFNLPKDHLVEEAKDQNIKKPVYDIARVHQFSKR